MNIMCFFFNDTATTEIYTLSLHDALPIYNGLPSLINSGSLTINGNGATIKRNSTDQFRLFHIADRKSTRLNSSHANISYAVFCLKKKKQPLITFSFKITNLLFSCCLLLLF